MSLEERLMKERKEPDTTPLDFDNIKQDVETTVSGHLASISDNDTYSLEHPFRDKVRGTSGSNKERTDGRKPLLLKRKWGLVRCGGLNRRVNPFCPELLIVKHGQKTKKCTRCGKRRTIGNKKVLAYSDSQGKIRAARNRLKKEESYRVLGDLDV